MAALALNETSRSGIDIIVLPPITFELTPKEKEWGQNIYAAVAAARDECCAQGLKFDPAVAIPSVVLKYQDLLAKPIGISPEGSMRGGVSDGGRFVAVVRLKSTEFHDHLFTESYQLPLHVENGAAKAISVEDGEPTYGDLVFGQLYNNKPGTSHAFVLSDGAEIWFLAYTGRSLAEDTYNVTENDAELYKSAVGEYPEPIHMRPVIVQPMPAGAA